MVDGPSRYAGRYYSPELDIEYRLEIVDDGLRLRAGPGIDREVRQIGPDHLTAQGMQLRFRLAQGRAEGFEVDAGRVRDLVFERVAG